MCRAGFSSSDGNQAQEQQLSPAASRGILNPNLALRMAPHLPARPGTLFLLFPTSPSSRTAPVFQDPLGHKQHKGSHEETPPRAWLSPQLAPGHRLSRARELPRLGRLRPGCSRSSCPFPCPAKQVPAAPEAAPEAAPGRVLLSPGRPGVSAQRG